MSNLIVVKQLPIIEEKLRELKTGIEAKVAEAQSLACTAETVKDIKKFRAEINSQFAVLEAERKAVKTAIMAPYEAFEAVYKECVSIPLKSCDEALAERIKSVEGQLKAEKEDALNLYFVEYAESKHLEWLTLARAKINVTLSASDKSLRTMAAQFIDNVSDDVAMIESQEFADEVLVEYKNRLNLLEATTVVRNRKLAIQKEIEARETAAAEREAEEQAVKLVESFAPPVAIEEPPVPAPPVDDPVMILSFKVKAPVSKLRALKKYLEENGYEYQ